MVIFGIGRAAPVVLTMSAVVWVAPLLAVPMLGCLAMPVALPALFVLGFCPLMGLQPGVSVRSSVTGIGLLLVGGLTNAAYVMVFLTHVHTVLLGRFDTPWFEPTVIGWGLLVWGVLTLGAGFGRRTGGLESAAFASAFVAIAPLSAGVLALYDAFGFPMSA